MKSILLLGAAGVGKTSLAEFIAAQEGGRLLYLLNHEWVTAEDYMLSIDISAVARSFVGDKESSKKIYTSGILHKAIIRSHTEKIFILIDELDKASERIDALLLDFIQNCRINDEQGNLIYGNPENITLFITSNQMRDIIDPLSRRVLKVHLDFLPAEVEASLLSNGTGEYHIDSARAFVREYVSYEPMVYENAKLQKLIVKIANYLRSHGLDISLYEMRQFYLHIPMCRDKIDWLELLIRGWFIRNEEYEEALLDRFKSIKNIALAINDLYKESANEDN